MPFHPDFIELRSLLVQEDHDFNGSLVHLECEDKAKKQEAIDLIEGLGIQTNTLGITSLEFRLNHDGFDVFYNEDDFISNFHSSEPNQDIYLLYSNYNGPIKFDYNNLYTLDQKGEKLEYYFFNNYFGYERLKKILDSTQLTDHKDNLNNNFILLSPDQGTFRLGYARDNNDYNVGEDLSDNPEILQKELDKGPDFYRFLKEVMITRLSDIDRSERAYKFYIDLEKIIEEAKRNYEVFLNKFDFAKLKDELRHEKEKYISSIQEIISKLFNKVVSIPISISAAAFALYRVKEHATLSTLILVGYLVYTLFTLYLLKVVWDDNQEIESDFKTDIGRIKDKSPLTQDDVSDIDKKMGRRFKYLNRSIIFVAAILLIFGIAFSTVGIGFITSSISTWVQFLILTIPVVFILLFAGSLL